MARAFSQIAYTPSVRDAQERYGSQTANAAFDTDPQARDHVSERDAQFIQEVDTLFIASVGENGWPYVQHRGGPRGFLKVLDERTVGFADYAGNRQYISAGNVSNDARVMLILIDFATRRRLKIWGRARIVHETEDPALIARLEDPAYRARIERGYVITTAALDFNCPQHITQRFSEQELAEMAATGPGADMLRRLLRVPATPAAVLGTGPLELVVTAIRQLTPRVRAYQLRGIDGAPLPQVAPGAHLAVPVRLENGAEETRRYSIASVSLAPDAWEIAVLRADDGRGGSVAVHRDYGLGTVLRCAMPKNDFALHEDARPAVLLAGGIGITAVKPMAAALAARNVPFQLHYAARSRAEMAYRDELPAGAALYFSEPEGERLDLARVFDATAPGAVFYVCGPQRLIDAVCATAQGRSIDADRVRYERFGVPAGARDQPVELVLQRSGLTVHVPAHQSLLDAVMAAGVDAPSDCRLGNCGACAVKVVDGVPEHRDNALTPAERELAGLMCPCVSRARTTRLVLDL